MVWFGADPGGQVSFGVAVLRGDGSFDTALVRYADEALDWVKQEPQAAGIDAPLWWSSGRSGDRKADCFLRTQYQIHAGTVQTPNSLRGAVLVQGTMLALRLRQRFPRVTITETHPKALLIALGLSRQDILRRFNLHGNLPASEHEQDALVSAVVAREGSTNTWCDLAQDRFPSEQDPAKIEAGPIRYWWPSAFAMAVAPSPGAP